MHPAKCIGLHLDTLQFARRNSRRIRETWAFDPLIAWAVFPERRIPVGSSNGVAADDLGLISQ